MKIHLRYCHQSGDNGRRLDVLPAAGATALTRLVSIAYGPTATVEERVRRVTPARPELCTLTAARAAPGYGWILRAPPRRHPTGDEL
ncbi:hypothetical protein EVAR_100184_1 [Eumeta japonica]|uniref:Uncharacterized protein n=1 Tax=Eumeta variegata TaxID=151549 RepID=A0A4C2A4Z4_EUMVA|nr:hypothetical protein EVAR_100184_1 [Eumeta japonica]